MVTKKSSTKKETKPKAERPETIEEHIRRLGCFSPGEVDMLTRAGVTHAKIDQLANDKGKATESSDVPAETPLP